jgi:hypothetical protein
VKVEKAISLAINKKECTPTAVKTGKGYKSCVNIIVTVAKAKNHQTDTPQIKVSKVTIQIFLKVLKHFKRNIKIHIRKHFLRGKLYLPQLREVSLDETICIKVRIDLTYLRVRYKEMSNTHKSQNVILFVQIIP